METKELPLLGFELVPYICEYDNPATCHYVEKVNIFSLFEKKKNHNLKYVQKREELDDLQSSSLSLLNAFLCRPRASWLPLRRRFH